MIDLATELQHAGVKLAPYQQAGADVALRWDPAVTGPILGGEVLVALPDMHLATFGAGDIFRGTDPTARDRLLSLLKGLVDVGKSVPAMSIVHVGDLYDVWRAYPEYKDHPTSDYRRIEDAYGDCIGMLTQTLGARVCVGNHDAALGVFPPSWARTPNGVTTQLAYAHTFGSGRVLAFHGHQEDSISRAMQAQDGSDVVQIMTEVAKISNPLSQLVQRGFDMMIDFFSDSALSLTDTLGARWPGADPPPDAHGFTSPRWCDRAGRDVLQRLVGALPNADALRLVIVGHSHRAGISAVHVEGQLVPLVDVGSWVWGRSQLAIAREGELRLWTIA
jgi:UDP-2,3-diacylglucosamine pyrophosphatase LpxH